MADGRRGTSRERGYTRTWEKIRALHLAEFPLCYDCLELHAVTAATEVHHIKALVDGGSNDDDNLMSLCKSCHSKRTQGFASVRG